MSLVALVLVALTPAAAHAADELGLSNDGATWSGSLEQPLFDSAIRWVPGDSRSESFFVRNQAQEDGELSVRVLAVTRDDLLDTGDLQVSARAGEGPWSRVDEPGTHVLVQRDLAVGERERVDVRVELDPASTNVSQLRMLDLQLDARLTQSLPDAVGDRDDEVASGGAERAPGTGGQLGTGGLLPSTGGIASWILLLAGVSVVAGTATLVRRGRI